MPYLVISPASYEYRLISQYVTQQTSVAFRDMCALCLLADMASCLFAVAIQPQSELSAICRDRVTAMCHVAPACVGQHGLR